MALLQSLRFKANTDKGIFIRELQFDAMEEFGIGKYSSAEANFIVVDPNWLAWLFQKAARTDETFPLRFSMPRDEKRTIIYRAFIVRLVVYSPLPHERREFPEGILQLWDGVPDE